MSETGRRIKQGHSFDSDFQFWKRANLGRPPRTALIIFARSNGNFTVWDPARNYYRRSPEDPESESPRMYNFGHNQVWTGIEDPLSKRWLCNGLIRDWVLWQKEQNPNFETLCKVLRSLSPSDQETLEPGTPKKILVDDDQLYPTLKTPQGDVPIVLASEAIRRISALAYLLVWTWTNHAVAAERRKWNPTQRIVILFDELEAHLHPRWQRRIIPALMEAVSDISLRAKVQLIGVTHAPLLVSSLENLFNQDKDKLFVIESVDKCVQTKNINFIKKGDANAWFTSNSFSLPSTLPFEAEQAVFEAKKWLDDPNRDVNKYKEIGVGLANTLAEAHPFWSIWKFQLESLGLEIER